MLKSAELYYFSPTGGTKAYGEMFCQEASKNFVKVDLGAKDSIPSPESELVVFAAPVFGGRIPAFVSEKIKVLDGSSKKAVTLAVYGTRAYEDALLELNDAAEAAGFEIVASGAVVSEHSIVPEVGKGRPDNDDEKSICDFARKVLKKLDAGDNSPVSVPGNSPYKELKSMPATPICLPECGSCGHCKDVCPTDAISIDEEGVKTNLDACIMCMACIAACPNGARILPPPVKESTTEKLSPLIPVYRENEYFL